MKFRNLSNKGLSLPLVIGLVSVLMVASVAANEFVIRNLKSTGQIEGATRAYLAAEGGMEDALYELSAHFAGYETPELTDEGNVRTVSLGANSQSRWAIRSHTQSDAPEGKIESGEKQVINLFNDDGGGNTVEINTLNVSTDFEVKLKIPEAITALADFQGLVADSDRDDRTNEDGPLESDATCFNNPADADCDGRTDEDSNEDPVVYWKLVDDVGDVLTPLRGCLSDSAAGNEKSELCEKDWSETNDFTITLNQDTVGENQNGQSVSIGNFINQVITESGQHLKLTLELLVVSPLEDATDPLSRIEIPHLEYIVSYDTNLRLPDPLFTIQSDGFDRDYKQSLTAKLKPRTVVPLFDFTILQQD